MKRIIITTASLCMVTLAHAGGYRVAIQGQKALGMGHTGVAIAESSEVVFFNPASMSLLESEMEMTAGITLLTGTTRYQNVDTNTSAKTDNPIGTPVNTYLVNKVDQQLSWGIGLYTPYGNTVEWEKDWVGSHLVNTIELKTVYIQPTISYRFNDQISVGFGPTYVNGQVELNRNLSSSLVDENGNRSNVTISATGVDAWGYNLGIHVTATDDLNFGISYRSKVELEARGGKANFSNVPSSLSAAFADTQFDADLPLPAELTIGVAYKIDSNTLIAFDINRTYWNAFESLDIDFTNPLATDSINPRNYEDSNIYRIGIQRTMNQDFTLRAGIYFDQTPIPDGFYTPETARNDAVSYTAGGTYNLSKNMKVDFSLLMVTFDEFNGAYDPQNFSGRYKTSAFSVGIGLDYTF